MQRPFAPRGPRAHGACAVLAALLALPSHASAPRPAELLEQARGRDRALRGDVAAAQGAWDGILAASPDAVHAVVLGTACGDGALAAALETWRDAFPVWIAEGDDGCHVLAWGHFGSHDAATAAANEFLGSGDRGGRFDVVVLVPPLRGRAGDVARASPPEQPAPLMPERSAPLTPERARESPPVPAREEPQAEPPPEPVVDPAAAVAASPPAAAAPAPRPPSGTAADLFAAGNDAYSQGRIDDAIEAFRASTVADPRNPRAFNNLGTALLVQGDAVSAESAFRSAIAIDPAYGRAHLNLGTALYTQGRAADARDALERVIDLEPRNVDAHHNLGALLVEERDWTGAEAVLLRGLAENPDDARLRSDLERVRAHASVVPRAAGAPSANTPASAAAPCRSDMSLQNRARLAQRLFTEGRRARDRGDLEAAEDAFEAALDCDPTSPAVLNHLGATRLELEDWTGALRALELALVHEPGSLEASVNLAFALFHLGRCDESVATLKSLVVSRLDSAEARFQLGRILYRCGRPTEAEIALDEASAMSPGGDDRASRLLARVRAERVGAP